MNIYGGCVILGYRWHTLCREFTFKGSFTSSSDVATTTSGQRYSLRHSGMPYNCKACLWRGMSRENINDGVSSACGRGIAVTRDVASTNTMIIEENILTVLPILCVGTLSVRRSCSWFDELVKTNRWIYVWSFIYTLGSGSCANQCHRLHQPDARCNARKARMRCASSCQWPVSIYFCQVNKIGELRSCFGPTNLL